jgi:hypothetical protein
LSEPNVEIMTSNATNAAPAGPIARSAAVAATSVDDAITGIGSTYRYAALASRYTTTTTAMPPAIARGKVRRASRISPAT